MPASTKPETGAELLARIQPQLREEKVAICLRPDLLDEWEAAEVALETQQIEDAASGRLGKGNSAKAKSLAKKIQDLEAQIDATQVIFHFRAMSKDRWQELVDEHPPRKGNEMDFFVGYNRDAVSDESIRRCLLAPVFEDCTERGCEHIACGSWQQFTKTINPSEWQELRTGTQKVNRAVVEAPKSGLASRVLSRGAAASKQPEAGE